MPTPHDSIRTSSRRAVLAAGAIVPLSSLLPGHGVASASEPSHTMPTCCPIVELRQYTLHPGTRDRFVDLFEREFVESQEAVGISLIGFFRDLDDPDRYVWLRGFPDMEARKAALGAFYGGDLWKRFRTEANASINDSDNVLLLRRPNPAAGFDRSMLLHPPRDSRSAPHGVVIGVLHYLDDAVLDDFTVFFEEKMRPQIERLGLPIHAYFVTERSPNTFPKLPVREKERVLAWFTGAPDLATWDRRLEDIHHAQSWREGASDPILHQLARKPEILRLSPADRSPLRT